MQEVEVAALGTASLVPRQTDLADLLIEKLDKLTECILEQQEQSMIIYANARTEHETLMNSFEKFSTLIISLTNTIHAIIQVNVSRNAQ